MPFAEGIDFASIDFGTEEFKFSGNSETEDESQQLAESSSAASSSSSSSASNEAGAMSDFFAEADGRLVGTLSPHQMIVQVECALRLFHRAFFEPV